MQLAPKKLTALGMALAVLMSVSVTDSWAKSPSAKGDEPILMVSMPVEKAGNGIKTISAQTVVAAPPAFVWQRLTAYNELSSALPGYDMTPAGKMLDVSQKVSRLLPTYRYRVRVDANSAQHQLRFSRVSGDFKFLEATYKLTPRNGGKETLVVYELKIDPGTHLPGTAGIIRDNTRDTLSAFRSHVQSGYQKSVIGKN